MKIFLYICISIIQFNVPQHSATLKNKSFNEAGYYTPLDCDYATRFREGIFMKEIPLSKNGKNKGKYVALVDDSDYEILSQYGWSLLHGKTNNYARAYINGKNIKMNRLLLGITDPKIKVDHIDRNGLNNQRNNLRIATVSQNSMNKKPSGRSKYLGVCLTLNKYWKAQIVINKKPTHLGSFKTEIEAAKCYDLAAIKYHGEFANLNFKSKQ